MNDAPVKVRLERIERGLRAHSERHRQIEERCREFDKTMVQVGKEIASICEFLNIDDMRAGGFEALRVKIEECASSTSRHAERLATLMDDTEKKRAHVEDSMEQLEALDTKIVQDWESRYEELDTMKQQMNATDRLVNAYLNDDAKHIKSTLDRLNRQVAGITSRLDKGCMVTQEHPPARIRARHDDGEIATIRSDMNFLANNIVRDRMIAEGVEFTLPQEIMASQKAAKMMRHLSCPPRLRGTESANERCAAESNNHPRTRSHEFAEYTE